MCDCSQSKRELHSTEFKDHWIVVIVCTKCGKALHQYRVNKPKP